MKKCLQTFFVTVIIFFIGADCILAQPTASFTIIYPMPVCVPATFSFTNTSTGLAPLTYSWQFIDSQHTDTAKNPAFTFDTCGNFSVILTVADSNGATDADTQHVLVFCAPQAQFTFIQSVSCDTAFVQFFDETAGNPQSRLWKFGDAASGANDSSALKTPTHHYASSGEYIVSLKIISGAGCVAVKSDTLNIPASPTANFSVNDSTICLNDTAKFFDTSTPIDSIVHWLYNFGDPSSGNKDIDSSQNAIHIFSSPGEYSVSLTVKTNSGCNNTASHIIKVNPLPIADAGLDQTICFGDSAQLNASGGIFYLWQPANLLSDSAIENPLAFPSATQKYLVQVTDSNGCEASDSVVVNIHSANANAGSDTSICSGSSAQLHASGGISYSWHPASSLSDSTISNPVASPLQTTTYVVSVVDSSGCKGKDSVTVFVHQPIQISFIGIDSIYCSNHEVVNLQASPGGGIFSGEGVSGNQFFPSTLASDSSYNIIYFYTDSIGCTAQDTQKIFIAPIPAVSISSDVTQICKNGNPISFIVSPQGGILVGPGISNDVFNPLLVDSTGDYKILYAFADSLGCGSSDSIVITVIPLPQISISNDTTVCESDSVQLHTSGGIHYLWNPSSGLSNDTIPNPIAFPQVTTKYFVTVTGVNGCSATDSVLISIFSLSSVDAGHDTSVCIGDSIMLNASGGNQYSWSPTTGLSDATIANPLAFPSVTMMYTVTVVAGNCLGKDSVLVTVNALPIIQASNDTFVCKGSSVQLNAEGAQSYSWQPASSLNDSLIQNPIAIPESSTNYFVTGTDIHGCKGTDSVFVEVRNLPNVHANNDTSICLGDTLQLHASGANIYLWSPPNSLSDPIISNPLAFPTVTTQYVVTGTNLFGCSNTDTVLVSVHYSGNFISANDTSTCFGSSITLSATGAESYSWSPGNLLNDSTIANPIASLITTTTFVLTGTSQGCSGKDTITVIVNPLPVITASNDSAICSGNPVQLHASGALLYQWQPDSSLNNAQSSNPVATPLTTTTYTVVGTDGNGCSNSNAVTITVNPLPVIIINADTSICFGDTILMIASGALNYQWQPSGELISPLNDSTLAHPSSTTTFTVSGIDVNGCENSVPKTITVHPLPSVNAGNDQQVCANIPVQLSASGGLIYSWQPTEGLNDPNISNPTATVNATITYTVTATDANSCSNKDEVTLNLVPPLNASASHDTTICAGTSAQLFATGGVSYIWIPVDGLNDANISNPVASPSSTTHYTVFVSDGICYTDTFTVKVSVQNLPTVNAGADAAIITGSPYQMNATASEGNYEWSPSTGLSCSSCLNPTATPSQTTTYTLTVSDSVGCSSSDDVTLNVSCSNDVIFIPNAFTPNGNGQNDILYVRALGNVNLNFFRVYDRWGKIIFETHNLNDGWDGTFNNKPMMPGAYLYEWEATCGSGDLISKQGNVTLLR